MCILALLVVQCVAAMLVFNAVYIYVSMIGCGVFLFQAEDGIRYLVRSRGLGDVYKRQALSMLLPRSCPGITEPGWPWNIDGNDYHEFVAHALSLIHI